MITLWDISNVKVDGILKLVLADLKDCVENLVSDILFWIKSYFYEELYELLEVPVTYLWLWCNTPVNANCIGIRSDDIQVFIDDPVQALTYSGTVAGGGVADSTVVTATTGGGAGAGEPPPTLGLPFPFPCFPGQFRYCLSKRGKPAIEVGAHRFCFNGRAASGKVWWRCSRNPRCRAAVHTFGLRVVQMNSAHTCGVRATPLRPMF